MMSVQLWRSFLAGDWWSLAQDRGYYPFWLIVWTCGAAMWSFLNLRQLARELLFHNVSLTAACVQERRWVGGSLLIVGLDLAATTVFPFCWAHAIFLAMTHTVTATVVGITVSRLRRLGGSPSPVPPVQLACCAGGGDVGSDACRTCHPLLKTMTMAESVANDMRAMQTQFNQLRAESVKRQDADHGQT